MKFRRSFRGKGKTVYVIRPQSRYMESGMALIRYPLRAEFVDGFFDSDRAAEAFAWSSDEKELVERWLCRHADFGHGLYLDASEPNAVPVADDETAPAEDGTPDTLCIASVETDGESRMCGKPTVDAAGELCALHAPEYAQTGV